MRRLGKHTCACKREKFNSNLFLRLGAGWCQQWWVQDSGVIMAQSLFHLYPWNSSMLLAFAAHLSSACHSRTLLASSKNSSVVPSDFHASSEHRLWPGLGPTSNSEPFTVAMGKMFLLSRPVLYDVVGRLGETGWSQPHLNTQSQWVGDAISRNILAGFKAE